MAFHHMQRRRRMRRLHCISFRLMTAECMLLVLLFTTNVIIPVMGSEQDSIMDDDNIQENFEQTNSLSSAASRIKQKSSHSQEQEDLMQQMMAEKPWYMRKMIVGDVTLPVSVATIGAIVISMFYMLYFALVRHLDYVEASHILLKDLSNESAVKLDEWKKKIGTDENQFAKYAKQYSDCPSKKVGGNLGKFYQYEMAPAFDQVCFDSKTPVNVAYGPVQTQFGWHLIYIHHRKLKR